VKINLNGKWRFKKAADSDYKDGSVPGCIMNDLIENSMADDPYYRDNEYAAYDLFRHDYEYTREITVDKKVLDKDSIRLICEGIDTLSEIYLNGKLIGETDNMHRRWVFDIKPYLDEVNVIKVIIKSPVDFIEKAWAEKNNIWGVCAKDGYQYIRKAHYMFGWDWGPAIPDGGIWRDIYIEAHDSAAIEDVYISQIHNDANVTLVFTAKIAVFEDPELSLSVFLIDPDGNEAGAVAFSEGKAEITVAEPRLWWPAGYGMQNLYTIVVSLSVNGYEEDSRLYRIGLRTLGISREDDEWGQEFAYIVNGIKIFAKGANYIPEDNILARCSRERTERLIKNAVDANFNSLRVWGGGIYPEDYFFDLCDEYGLIVWQDFMFACAQYVLKDDFVDSIKAEIRDNIRRLRHHASIALWCGNNEMEWLWMDTQTEGRSKQQMDEYLQLFEGIIPPISAEEDPDRLYWPASPSSGGGFDEPNAENRGDVHYWDVWHGLKPFTEYRNFYFRFCSEFGFQSFPCLKTVESYTVPEDRNIFSYVMESHQKNGGANGKILYYLSENFKNPRDFESMLYVSQLLQAEAIKYGVEHWRRNRGRCMGAIYWQFNDCWPVASWSSIDSFQRWKALHYFAKRFYNTVLLSVEESGLKADLHLSNESLDEIKGTVFWKIIDTSGSVIKQDSFYISVDPLTSKKVAGLDFSNDLSDMDKRRESVLVYEFSGSGFETGSTLLFVPNKYFKYEKTEIKTGYSYEKGILEISFESSSYAAYVELMPLECECVFSDNYFSIIPGDTKKITIDFNAFGIGMQPDDFMNQLQIRSIADTF
jgi:beta-mannosidase